MTIGGRVIVVGAGPAGCSAAIVLARAGFRVQLLDKGQRGRDKVCGDALIPDALAALEALGCLDTVLARAHPVERVRLVVSDHAPIDLRGRLACLPRAELDAVLLAEAEAAGAAFLPGLDFSGVLEHAGRIGGVRLRGADGRPLELQADHVVLATGAAAGPLEAAGMCLRRVPSGIGLRAYFEVPSALAQEADVFTLSYDRSICPAFGYVFPGPGGVFNLGVGYFLDALRRPATTNLRDLWSAFLQGCPAAARIREHGRQLTAVRGAPLRTSLRGARLTRPGLMLVGEAVGTTYAFSGEGIGKAMQSGMLAAQCLAQDPAQAEAQYEAGLRSRFRSQYDAYRFAQGCLSFPIVYGWLAKRAHRSSGLHAHLEGLLAETVHPRELLSPVGMLRAMFA